MTANDAAPRTAARDWLYADLAKEHPHARPGDLAAALAEEQAEARVAALREALERLPRYVGGSWDDTLTPDPEGDLCYWDDIAAALAPAQGGGRWKRPGAGPLGTEYPASNLPATEAVLAPAQGGGWDTASREIWRTQESSTPNDELPLAVPASPPLTVERLAGVLRPASVQFGDDPLYHERLAAAIAAAYGDAAAPADEAVRRAIAHAGYEYRDPCDACGGIPDPREPDVVCAWCGGVNARLIRLAAQGASDEVEEEVERKERGA